MKKTCVVLCGGGTGGHIYPNIAIAQEIKPFRRVCYIGNGGMEEKIAKENDIEFFHIHAPKFQRKFTIENAKLPFALIKSIKEAKTLLKELTPAVIFSKGGYVALPVCLAGLSLNIPVLCHESDLTLGLANKITHKMGGTLLTSFKPTMSGKKRVINTGSPLRKAFQTYNQPKTTTKSQGDTQNLLILGGSQGAKAINEAIIENLFPLTKKYNITHITGVGKMIPTADIKKHYQHKIKSELATALSRYHAIEYSNDMPSLYNSADLAISRGGANTLFELLECEVPTLVIPLEKGSRGDQVDNAKYLSQEKLCHTLAENNLFALTEALATLENSATQIRTNIKTAKVETPFNGTKNIVNLILSQK